MGGNAFTSTLPPTSFPRLPPAVYAALKTRLFPQIQSIYTHVAVPFEAPEKASYGDLDFVVAGPKHHRHHHHPSETSTRDAQTTHAEIPVNAPHELVQETIGAAHVNPMEGNRTSNFAVPIARGEWSALGHADEEEEARRGAEGGEIFYQVDVNVCASKNEWDRIVFFHAYGDLGMIMGLIARNAGFALGSKGLKVPNPPHHPIDLSHSFDTILPFMGLSMPAWRAGFATQRAVFEWAGTSRFFDPTRFRAEGEGFSKVKPERKMYAEFVQWAMAQAAAMKRVAEQKEESREEREVRRMRPRLRDEALVYFGKKEEFEREEREREARVRLKEMFSGSRVRDWADMGEYWKGVKMIMDGVRERVGGDEGVLRVLDEEGKEGIRKIVLEVKEELGLGLGSRKELRGPVDELTSAVEKVRIASPPSSVQGS
ncbi:hypothetical protein Hypma_016242 [Hypsizygus marmoreus]|uniref:Uncharacterized protein n=1 Tax=Hypsizygus marmoreus TaxID=39966 RepID=A0A369J6S0_HYPMA|nr:hypothetical protein Hypma_016242 [Hypsizygus marmoreus]